MGKATGKPELAERGHERKVGRIHHAHIISSDPSICLEWRILSSTSMYFCTRILYFPYTSRAIPLSGCVGRWTRALTNLGDAATPKHPSHGRHFLYYNHSSRTSK